MATRGQSTLKKCMSPFRSKKLAKQIVCTDDKESNVREEKVLKILDISIDQKYSLQNSLTPL